MSFSDNPLEFNRELLNIMYDALKDIYIAGGVKTVEKGDFKAIYISPSDILRDINKIKMAISISENGNCFVRKCR